MWKKRLFSSIFSFWGRYFWISHVHFHLEKWHTWSVPFWCSIRGANNNGLRTLPRWTYITLQLGYVPNWRTLPRPTYITSNHLKICTCWLVDIHRKHLLCLENWSVPIWCLIPGANHTFMCWYFYELLKRFLHSLILHLQKGVHDTDAVRHGQVDLVHFLHPHRTVSSSSRHLQLKLGNI